MNRQMERLTDRKINCNQPCGFFLLRLEDSNLNLDTRFREGPGPGLSLTPDWPCFRAGVLAQLEEKRD